MKKISATMQLIPCLAFICRKKNYEMAEKYLNYFSDYDPMKKVKQGQLYMKQG